MEAAMSNIIHNFRKNNSPQLARIRIREVLNSFNGNVSKTAKKLKISRHTVRRARDGALEDYPKAPKNPKRKYDNNLRELIIYEAKNTNYGARRLSYYLREKYSLFISENTIKYILRSSNVKKKKIRTKNKNRRPLYNYEALLPFTEIQVDTKHILDEKALPASVYKHIKDKKLPEYAFNAIDAKTRIRFMMYSHSLNSTYGHIFLFLVVLWLRLHNVRNKIRIRVDNGSEFFGTSEKKLKRFNDFLSPFDAEVYCIPPKAKHLQGIIENAHKQDDEFFYSSHPLTCDNYHQFLFKSQQWLNVWNTAKSHHGIDMEGLTPLRKLLSLKTMINQNVVKFPVLRLEDVMIAIGSLYDNMVNYLIKLLINQSGKYVIDKYLF